MLAMSSSSCAFSKTFFATFLLICWILSLRFCTFFWWTWKQRTHLSRHLQKIHRRVCVYENVIQLLLSTFSWNAIVFSTLETCWVVSLPCPFLVRYWKERRWFQINIHLMFYVVSSKNVWMFNDLRMDLFIDQALSRAYTMSGSCLPHLSTGTWTFSKGIWLSDMETLCLCHVHWLYDDD